VAESKDVRRIGRRQSLHRVERKVKNPAVPPRLQPDAPRLAGEKRALAKPGAWGREMAEMRSRPAWRDRHLDCAREDAVNAARRVAHERFHEARGFDEWQENRSWAIAPAIGVVQNFVASFEEYPPSQTSFTPSAAGLTERLFIPAP
jgi:hypothetical protein